MSFEAALLVRAQEDPGLNLLIGAGEAARAAWDERPQWERLPALTFQTISCRVAQTMEGVQTTQFPWVQCDAWARTPEEALALREAAIAAFLPAVTIADVRFQRAFAAWRSRPEQAERGVIHRFAIDFRFTTTIQP